MTAEVLADDSWHVRRPVNDNEIIERALYTSEITGRDVILAAGDFSMLYQASSAGLKTALTGSDRPRTIPRREQGRSPPAQVKLAVCDAARSEQVNDAVNKILDALRSDGYKPTLRIEDIEIDGDGPVPE